MQGKRDVRRALLYALAQARQARVQLRKAKARLRNKPPEQTRQLLLMIETLDIALEAIIIRLDTMLSANLYGVELLGLPIELVRRLKPMTRGLPPVIRELVDSVGESLEVASKWVPGGFEGLGLREEIREEAKKIIEEAEKEARKRLEESLEG